MGNENVQNNQAGAPFDPMQLIEVEVSSDAMKAYVKFLKPQEKDQVFRPTKEQVMQALSNVQVVAGIKEDTIEKLVTRPIYNIKIQVCEGSPAEDGKDGYVEYFVVKDKEYKPEVDEDANIDFKNLDYFQMVKEGQMLAAVHVPEEGHDGQDVYGREIPSRAGKTAKSPQGKNTTYNEEENVLFAACDGIVNFVTDVVNINDVMHIAGDVANNTGNIDFSGDVIVEGDVCAGFSIKAGGNVIVKGVVDSANIEAGGDVQIVKGVNGDDASYVKVGGNFRSLYIEHCKVEVKGDILAESIIESDITCEGNIDVSQTGKGIVVGGVVNVKGDICVKTLGNENERVTNIKIIGIETGVQDEITSMMVEKETNVKNIEKLKSARRKMFVPLMDEDDPVAQQIKTIDKQIISLQEAVEEINKKIQVTKEKWAFEYHGTIACRGKMYYGTRIYFGEERYQFNTESLDHCKIYWYDGEIVNANL